MSRPSGTLPNPYEELYTTTKEFLASTSERSNIEEHRERFKARALNDISNVFSHSSPLALGHERERQKDYFRRLKFKYLEQQAKKSFLFAITGDVPERVAEGENDKLESDNQAKKAGLKRVKADIAAMREETLALGAENSKNHAALEAETAEVTKLQREIRDMELELARIKTAHPPDDRMTVDEAEAKLEGQYEEMAQLQGAIGDAGQKSDELRSVIAERAKRLLVLAREREVQEAKAAGVRRARTAGGTLTQVHDLCQWYEAMLNTYRSLLGIRAARAVSASELVLEYELPRTGVAELTLHLDNGVLRGARLVGPAGAIDIAEAERNAVERNDAAGLISDVLVRLRPLEPDGRRAG